MRDAWVRGHTYKMWPRDSTLPQQSHLGETWGRPRDLRSAVPIRFPLTLMAEMYELAAFGAPPPLTEFTQRWHSATCDECAKPRPSTERWSISARVALRSWDDVTSRPFRDVRRICLARPAVADAEVSIAAITASGDSPNLLRRLVFMSGTMCSWRGTPSPPSTTGVWRKGVGVSFGSFNQDLTADLTIRSSHLRYLADAGAKRVIVTPAVDPRFFEFLHLDIQSTGQKSHSVHTPSSCGDVKMLCFN